VWERNSAGRPWVSGQEGTAHGEEYLPEDLLKDMDGVGVDAAVLVPPGPWEGFRNDLALRAAELWPTRFAAMVTVDPAAENSRDTLHELLADPGTSGARLDFWGDAARAVLFRNEELGWVWGDLVAADRPVAIFVPGLLPLAARVAEAHPDLRIAICHMSMPKPPPGGVAETITELVGLARYPNVSVKVSGVPALSAETFPFADIHDEVLRVIDAFGPERVFWGSDHTRVLARAGHEYGGAVRLFTDVLRDRLDPDTFDALMGRSVVRWLRWGALDTSA
jgi:predicted TIM-barrel fold metal-dependent hydrolase